MKNQFLALSLLILVLAGCSKENELKKSVFIYDPEYYDLPAYSEWGYNTFGAYYDRDIFISNNDEVPAKVILTDSVLSFILKGQKGESYYYFNNNTEMKMTFNLRGFPFEQYSDLILFNDTIFDLENPACQLWVSIDTSRFKAEIMSGTLTFKRAQYLLVDKEPVEVILSGYFEFKAFINDEAVTISNGRFDVGIGPDNFYNN